MDNPTVHLRMGEKELTFSFEDMMVSITRCDVLRGAQVYNFIHIILLLCKFRSHNFNT